MSNALKFTTKGSVTIKVKADNKHLEIAVEDTGKGIPKDQQERVFERFYKVDSFVQGIGLGLTVARRSAELLGGTLTIDPDYTTGCRFARTDIPPFRHPHAQMDVVVHQHVRHHLDAAELRRTLEEVQDAPLPLRVPEEERLVRHARHNVVVRHAIRLHPCRSCHVFSFLRRLCADRRER